MENIMTAKEVAKFLKLSESTIYKLASNGEIPGFKIGDSWRFELEAIQELILKSKRKGKRLIDPIECKEKFGRRGRNMPDNTIPCWTDTKGL